MSYKQQVGLVLGAIALFAAVWMGLDFIRHALGRNALYYTLTGFFGLATAYLMVKNVLVWLEDQAASIWWLTAMLIFFCMTIASASKLTSYFKVS